MTKRLQVERVFNPASRKAEVLLPPGTWALSGKKGSRGRVLAVSCPDCGAVQEVKPKPKKAGEFYFDCRECPAELVSKLAAWS